MGNLLWQVSKTYLQNQVFETLLCLVRSVKNNWNGKKIGFSDFNLLSSSTMKPWQSMQSWKLSLKGFFLPKNPPSKAQCRQQRNAFLFDTNIICWLHDTGVNTVDDQKPFHVVGMIFLNVILGWSYNICDLWFSTEREKKTILDWSEVCLLNAYPKTLQHRPKITSEIIVPKDMNKSNELWQKCFIKTFLRSLYVFKLWEFSCYSYPNLNPVSNHQCTLCVINLVIVWIQIKILKKN